MAKPQRRTNLGDCVVLAVFYMFLVGFRDGICGLTGLGLGRAFGIYLNFLLFFGFRSEFLGLNLLLYFWV